MTRSRPRTGRRSITTTGAAAAGGLSHGWPLSADAFEDQMFFWPRAVSLHRHDRRGHGRSSAALEW